MRTTSGGRWSGSASRQSRRFTILRAAATVFAQVGYEHAHMEAIARAAGVTKVTVYAHFEDKSSLFAAVIEHWLAELPAPLLEAPAGMPLREQLTRIALALTQRAAHPSALALAHTLAISAQPPPGEYLERWRRRHRPYRQHLETLIARRCQCADPALGARQFLTLVVGRLNPPSMTDAVSEADERIHAIAAVDVFLSAYPQAPAEPAA